MCSLCNGVATATAGSHSSASLPDAAGEEAPRRRRGSPRRAPRSRRHAGAGAPPLGGACVVIRQFAIYAAHWAWT